MPAVRTKSTTSSSEPPSPPAKGWSKDRKAMLFEHVLKRGETDWEGAVPGKTSKQSSEQWKKTLLPHIKKTSGLY